jgi:hypothetical protein
VLQLAPDKFYAFSAALFAQQTDYFDVNVVHEARNATYARLARVAAGVGVDEQAVLRALRVDDKPAADGSLNIGNGVTNDLKLLVKVKKGGGGGAWQPHSPSALPPPSSSSGARRGAELLTPKVKTKRLLTAICLLHLL